MHDHPPTPQQRSWRRPGRRILAVLAASSTVGAAAIVPTFAAVQNTPTRDLRLIQVSDTHGKFVPHWENSQEPGKPETWQPNAGGFARTYTLVNKLRNQTKGANVFVMNGDNFHGSAELLFTKGRAAVPVMNKFAPDAYVPGNWDFADGAIETRARFNGIPLVPGVTDKVATPDGKPLVTFPVLAAGVYNGSDAPKWAGQPGTRLMKPYLIKMVNGTKVAIIGLNDDKMSDQGASFTIGLEVRAGFDGAPALVREVRKLGAEVVVAVSEAGLAQNVALARDVPGIDVVLSGDTHEETFKEIRVPQRNNRQTLVVESGEGTHVGQLDLKLAGRGAQVRVVKAAWALLPINASVPEDNGMKTLVDDIRKPFLSKASGGTFGDQPITRAYPGGGKPMVLSRPLDDVIGKTNVDLERHSVIPTEGDQFIAEAIRSLTGTQIAGTNGFRYDAPVPKGANITVGDVYTWLPIGAHVSTGEVTGSQLRDRFEKYLQAVLDPNPYRRTGGWLPVLAGARFSVDFSGPHGPGQDRIVRSQVYDAAAKRWVPLVDDKVYTIAGCFSPADALDRMCRMDGVRNVQFLVAGPNGALTMEKPLLKSVTPENRVTKRTAPDGVVAAPEALLRYLVANGGADTAKLAPYVGPTWVRARGSLPAPSALAPNAVQPLPGSGPWWLSQHRVG